MRCNDNNEFWVHNLLKGIYNSIFEDTVPVLGWKDCRKFTKRRNLFETRSHQWATSASCRRTSVWMLAALYWHQHRIIHLERPKYAHSCLYLVKYGSQGSCEFRIVVWRSPVRVCDHKTYSNFFLFAVVVCFMRSLDKQGNRPHVPWVVMCPAI
jgi:hypothetical protein